MESDLTPIDPDAASDPRTQLVDERIRLEAMRTDLYEDGLALAETESAGELSDNPNHPADLGTETFNRERDLGILEQVERELDDIERALRRLDQGTYGICEACNGPIGEERLAAVPHARFCVADQGLAEREAGRPGLVL